MKKVLFLGQRPLGEACFDIALNVEGIEIVAVASNKSAEVWWESNAIYKRATERGIPFMDNEFRNNDAIMAAIRSLGVDMIISVQHCWILTNEILSAVNGQAFNLHMAKLPQYKGHYPFVHAILNDEREYSVTLHWMTPKVDYGDIAYEATFPIEPKDTAFDLYHKACDASIAIFRHLVGDVARARTPPAREMSGFHRFYSRNSLRDIEQVIDLTDKDEIDRKSRALFFPPFTPAYAMIGGKRIYLLPQRLEDATECNLCRYGEPKND